MRVVVAEDNLLVRKGLVALLDSYDDVELVAVCETFDSLMEAVDQTQPDVVVTDARMPPTFSDEGIRAATELRQVHPGVAVVVLSQHADAVYARKLVECGSDRRAYLLKQQLGDSEKLLSVMRTVHKGGSFIDSEVVDALVAVQSRPIASAIHRLTRREVETLAEIAKGASNAAVADRLFISERAVERHINSIFAKLDFADPADVNRRVAAVLLFLSS